MAKNIIGNSTTKIFAESITVSTVPTANSDLVNKEYVDSVSDKKYTHNQLVTSDLWIINHNLGKHPSVTVIDSGGSNCIGEVSYTSENSLQISFSASFQGVAYLN